jgi:hypothetical protein
VANNIGVRVSIRGDESIALILGDWPANNYGLGLQILEIRVVALIAARVVSPYIPSG